MNDDKKRFVYPAIWTIVLFIILYLITFLDGLTGSMVETPIWFQIVLWILVYFGIIAGAIRAGLFGWG